MFFLLGSWPCLVQAQLVGSTDLNSVLTGEGVLRRVLGSVGNGAAGVPVAGGGDVDNDGSADYAFAAMRASPQGRNNAGQVFLVFGDGTAVGQIDTAFPDPRVLEIHGEQIQENAGSEIWMAEVTKDDFSDLIICRQNYSHDGRIGSGALTLIPGNARLRDMAANNEILDLASPPENLPIINIYGAMETSRLCIWARNADITGDNVDDFVAGADREQSHGQTDSGAVYVFRGGDHFDTSQNIDLADFGTVSPGNIARIWPRAVGSDANSNDYHFGATVQMADLDGNGRAEVLAAAALNRAGASLPPLDGSGNGSGGTSKGTVFIAWDDNFSESWIPAPDFIIDEGGGSFTIINGGDANDVFGEEILAGLDYDDDGTADLFSGDLTADGWGDVSGRINAGVGQVIYNPASLKNLEFDLDSPPEGFTMATIIGPKQGAIAGDTAMHGDFNNDGFADLAFSSPHDDPFGRQNAGTVHIILGQDGAWPEVSDLSPANFPSSGINIWEIYGANGTGDDSGDVLCYSGAAGDVTGDGVSDLIMNEMLGNGSSTADVGNLLVIDGIVMFKGQYLKKDGFETPP
jgi:hypothetical protein